MHDNDCLEETYALNEDGSLHSNGTVFTKCSRFLLSLQKSSFLDLQFGSSLNKNHNKNQNDNRFDNWNISRNENLYAQFLFSSCYKCNLDLTYLTFFSNMFHTKPKPLFMYDSRLFIFPIMLRGSVFLSVGAGRVDLAIDLCWSQNLTPSDKCSIIESANKSDVVYVFVG